MVLTDGRDSSSDGGSSSGSGSGSRGGSSSSSRGSTRCHRQEPWEREERRGQERLWGLAWHDPFGKGWLCRRCAFMQGLIRRIIHYSILTNLTK